MLNEPRSVERSLEWYRRACERVPGGTQLISRRPHIFAAGVAPVFAQRGLGSHVWDVDDQEYLDYGMSVSACILGYADPVVNDAVRQQLDSGVMYSLNHPAEVELAELLCETIPCAEMVRYAKGGGEACAMAVRIARGVTGRDRVLFCGYHGWHDWYLAANLAHEHTLDEHLLPEIEPLGVPRALAGTAIPFTYGDLDSLSTTLKRHAGEVACIMLEPMRSQMPPAGYLAGVRELADEHGAVLIFDEVTTGFRHAVGGIETIVDVTPDVAVLAKSLSNGFAMGAVVGRREVMQPSERMFISSTNWSELLGIRAAIVTLHEIRRRGVPARLRDYGTHLMEGWNEAAAEVGLEARLHGLPACPQTEFTSPDPSIDARRLLALYVQEMVCRGVLINAHPMPSAAHDEVDLQWTLQAVRESLVCVRDALQTGRVDEALQYEPAQPIFRRLVT